MDARAGLVSVPDTEPTADVTAETQPVDVADLRKAMGVDDTQQIPAVTKVVAVPPLAVTWGTKVGDKAALEAWATATAPPPGAGATDVALATEVCRELGESSHLKVHTALQPEGANP
jgi:hypothetical protein